VPRSRPELQRIEHCHDALFEEVVEHDAV
jgi:hypothetical protein